MDAYVENADITNQDSQQSWNKVTLGNAWKLQHPTLKIQAVRMNEITSLLQPTLFQGGTASDYIVTQTANGGLGTRHIPSGKFVPHVRSALSPEQLTQALQNTAMLENIASMQKLQVGLSAANLAVGVLNLGVSAWTAWKIHKMDKKLDNLISGVTRIEDKVDAIADFMQLSVQHLDALICKNSLMLGFIIENQGHLHQGIAALQQLVVKGFDSVHTALSMAEAKRESQALQEKMRVLFQYYFVCTESMRKGFEPPANDMRRIIDISIELKAWLDTRLSALPYGKEERLPFLTARAIAMKLELEARIQLDEAPESRTVEFDQFRYLLQQELSALSKDSTIYGLAVEKHALIEQYVFLSRSVQMPATLVEFESGTIIPFYPSSTMQWDDGLESVRQELNSSSANLLQSRLEIHTLEEHSAWRKIVGTRSQSDSIDSLMLISALGVPSDILIGEENARTLLLKTPKLITNARSRISQEAQ